MQFSSSKHGNSKATKLLLVAGLHVAIGTVFIHSMNTKRISLTLPEPLLVMIEPLRTPPPPPPIEPPKPTQQLAPPVIAIPKQETVVVTPPEPTVTAVQQTDAPPQASTPAAVATEVPPATNTKANTGQIHSAVFADANSCALPAYPASAARDGVTGTTTLALLVGVDGRVTSARIQQGSGSRILDRAALDALSLCKFKPAMSNGAPEAGWAQMAYVWKLD